MSSEAAMYVEDASDTRDAVEPVEVVGDHDRALPTPVAWHPRCHYEACTVLGVPT
jgi:hypothetical protein